MEQRGALDSPPRLPTQRRTSIQIARSVLACTSIFLSHAAPFVQRARAGIPTLLQSVLTGHCILTFLSTHVDDTYIASTAAGVMRRGSTTG